MKWIGLALGTTFAAAGLAWALVTTGHWPLDDRKQPATAAYVLNGTLGEWLLDRGEERPVQARPSAGSRLAGKGPPGGTAEPLTEAELAGAQQALRSAPQFQGRFRFTPAPAGRG